MKVPLILALLIFVLCVLSVYTNEIPGGKRYCTKKELRNVMSLACSQKRQKRSFYPLKSLKADKFYLFKRIFNIDDNTTGKYFAIKIYPAYNLIYNHLIYFNLVSIPELNFQMRLLYGPCNNRQKQSDVESLMEIYKNRDYEKNPNRKLTIDRLNIMNDYEPSVDDNDESSQSFKPLMRYRRGIVEECCKLCFFF